MKVLILGSGGREHALALAIAKSPRLSELFVAPGNPGCASIAQCVALSLSDHGSIIDFCHLQSIGLVVIGPEAPLVAGLADDLRSAGVDCFGPSKAAAQLEGSKGFTKDFCREFGIPTADYMRFADKRAALEHIRGAKTPVVIKADGLAAGKGVVIAQTIAEAEAAIETIFEGAFGDAGNAIVVEEFLFGEEASFFALCDGQRFVAFGSAQDHKRVGEGDTGPNTGGMGAYSPAMGMSDALQTQILAQIIAPTVEGMRRRGMPFSGLLFAGLMLTAAGPKLIEYNVRFGDPETEAILARLESDLLEFLLGCARGDLPRTAPQFSPHSAIAVIMAARGYPGAYAKGSKIGKLAAASKTPGVKILHAGTKEENGDLLADGGRVLAVTAVGATLSEAQERAYAAANAIEWSDGFFRRDIGARAIAAQRAADC